MDANTEAYVTKADLQQLATKADLQGLAQKIHNLEAQTAGYRNSIIYWMIGTYFGTMLLAGARGPSIRI